MTFIHSKAAPCISDTCHCLQLIQLLNSVEKYSGLADCKIEGMEPIAAKFQHILGTIKKKPYDILDHRKLDFDHDFDEFRRQIIDLEVPVKFILVSGCLYMGQGCESSANPIRKLCINGGGGGGGGRIKDQI